MDARGRDKPSEIQITDGSNVTKPNSVPAGTPIYLTPTRVTKHDVENASMAFLARNESDVVHRLQMEWNEQRHLVTSQLELAPHGSDIRGELYEQMHERHVLMVNQYFDKVWRAAAYAGAYRIGMDIAQKNGIAFNFKSLSENMNAYIDTAGAEMIANLDTQSRRAIRNTIRFNAVDRGGSVRQLRNAIAPIVGLTGPMANAVDRRRNEYIENGFDLDVANERAEGYAKKLLRQRADNIARTELQAAYNHGQLEHVRQLIGSNDIRDPVVKRFYTSLDERVCPVCGPLHGRVVGVEGTFPTRMKGPDGSANAPAFMPPIHPRCRCSVLWEFLDVGDVEIETSRGVFVQLGSGQSVPSDAVERAAIGSTIPVMNDTVERGGTELRVEPIEFPPENTAEPNNALLRFREQPIEKQLSALYDNENGGIAVNRKANYTEKQLFSLLKYPAQYGLDDYLRKKKAVAQMRVVRKWNDDVDAQSWLGKTRGDEKTVVGLSIPANNKTKSNIAVLIEPDLPLQKEIGGPDTKMVAQMNATRNGAANSVLLNQIGHAIVRREKIESVVKKEFDKIVDSIDERRRLIPDAPSGWISRRQSYSSNEWFAETFAAYFEHREILRVFEGSLHFDAMKRILKKTGIEQ